MSASVRDRYRALLAGRHLEPDPAQLAVVGRLHRLEEELAEHQAAQQRSSLWRLLAGGESPENAPKGLYIHGDVGRGKTMLMDLFFQSAPVERKRRAHFHEFMLEVHERIHAYRQALKRGEVADPDPMPPVAASIAEGATLLCFDEFHVTDIADAMILGRLFTRLFERGVVVVATSNVAPEDLYQGGLNRALFLPFIALLQERLDVVRLAARTDFRLEKLAGAPVWHVPADESASAALDRAFHRLAGGAGAPIDLTVKGRTVRVPAAANGTARFSFSELCGLPRAAADYLRIAREFHTVVIEHIPVMTLASRNEAKRFIILVDALYDHAVKLLASAEAPPEALYAADHGGEVQEFKRTVSRLIEMGSQDYLGRAHGQRDSAAKGATTGLVET